MASPPAHIQRNRTSKAPLADLGLHKCNFSNSTAAGLPLRAFLHGRRAFGKKLPCRQRRRASETPVAVKAKANAEAKAGVARMDDVMAAATMPAALTVAAEASIGHTTITGMTHAR